MAAWKPHQRTSAWRHRLKPKCRNMFIRNQRGMSISWNGIWLKYGQQPAELHWLIDRLVTRMFTDCLKAKSKYSEHLLWCVSLRYVTVMTFKTYTTAVMNKLRFVSQDRVRTAIRKGGQFCCNFVANLRKYVPKLWKYDEVWHSYCKKIRAQVFLPDSVHCRYRPSGEKYFSSVSKLFNVARRLKQSLWASIGLRKSVNLEQACVHLSHVHSARRDSAEPSIELMGTKWLKFLHVSEARSK